jgi:hypothetical protein
MGHVKCDYNKRLITLTSDNIKRLSLYLPFFELCFFELCARLEKSKLGWNLRNGKTYDKFMSRYKIAEK